MKDLKLTDHAVRRYVERVLNISDAELLKMMVPDNVKMSINAHGAGIFAISDTHMIAVDKEGVILTVMKKGNGSLQKRPNRNEQPAA